MDQLNVAIDAIILASSHAKRNFEKKKEIKEKGLQDFVTNVDKECEQLIKDKLLSFTNHNILSEESDNINNHSEYTWIIDPIDGTRNYIRGIRLYGVSIALAKNKKPILGVVSNPETGEIYSAQKDKGAHLNGESISVSNISTIQESLIYTSGLKKIKDPFFKIINNLPKVRILSSSAYELCHIASGRIEGCYKSSRSCWGYAAAAIIIEEAGGKVSNFDGSNWDLDSRNLIFSNGKIHNHLRDIIHK